MTTLRLLTVLLAAALCAPLPRATFAAPVAAGGLWRTIDERSIGASESERLIVPQAYRVYALDEALLEETLSRAPLEFTERARSGAPVILTIPMPNGAVERFRIQESSIMHPALAAKFPAIKTYAAQGIDDPAAVVRFDRTPAGFHAMIRTPRGTVFVDPYRRGDTIHYLSYYRRDFKKEGAAFECLVPGSDDAPPAAGERLLSGETLRTYRLALACTGEYAAFHGGTVDGAFAAMTTTMNRVNGVYEVDVAIRMVFVENNTSVVYTNAATDPYTNSSGSTMLGQNQTNLDNVIGPANYDIGHVFSTGGGGVAGLGVVCRASNKARGVTGLPQPVGDPFDVDYVAHEMGHQYGANHTFNGTQSSCGGGNRSASNAYEPGSGSTIMAYAGICGSVNLQSNSDAYFHGRSYDEITAYTTSGAGNGCAVQTPTANLPPAVDAGASYTIPISTPFELTAAGGADPNGDSVTYCWEQFDLGPALNTNTDNGSSPIFRSFAPTTSPTRTFPKIADIVNNTSAFGETFPTTNRTMNFRCTIRDNRAGGGGVTFDTATVTSTTSAGPFSVTSPNAPATVAGGSPLLVTWNVANTNLPPVDAQNVSIFLSLDGGSSYPILLRANTPNDGSESVTLPLIPSTTARVKVKAHGNVFFDISNANFTITSATRGGHSLGSFTPDSATFFLKNTNAPGAGDVAFIFGTPATAFVAIVGDWDGDRTDTLGLYDPASGTFFLKNANAPGPADLTFIFGVGNAGYTPLAGDWDGDGIDTIGLYDPAAGAFFLKNSNGPGIGDVVFLYGPPGAGFQAIVGDWNADGVDTIGLYDPSAGTFFLRNANSIGVADITVVFGVPGLRPLAGDWNVDGSDTIGVYNPVSGTWFLRNANAPGAADVTVIYGPLPATPLGGDWDGL